MPPAISDDEHSDSGEDLEVTPSATLTTNTTTLRAAAATSTSRNGSKNADEDKDDSQEDQDEADEDDDQDDDAAEDLEEDEYVVEKILSHTVYPDGSLRFEVKWEGYDKKADRTWETKDNLRENASEVLDEYLESVGGQDKILQESKEAIKSKKRGRPASTTQANGGKRRKAESHPSSTTPPASARQWKPPAGSWEDEVESIDACHDEATGRLIVYLTWKNGQKTQHETKVIYQRCPQKMLQFYERHVKIVK